MDARDFALLVKKEAIDVAVQSTLRHINDPQLLADEPESADPKLRRAIELLNAEVRKWQKENEWYRSLDQAQRQIFAGLLRECAKRSALNFCSLFDLSIDPNTADETRPDPEWRRFEVRTADKGEKKIIVNLEESENFRDLLYKIC